MKACIKNVSFLKLAISKFIFLILIKSVLPFWYKPQLDTIWYDFNSLSFLNVEYILFWKTICVRITLTLIESILLKRCINACVFLWLCYFICRNVGWPYNMPLRSDVCTHSNCMITCFVIDCYYTVIIFTLPVYILTVRQVCIVIIYVV